MRHEQRDCVDPCFAASDCEEKVTPSGVCEEAACTGDGGTGGFCFLAPVDECCFVDGDCPSGTQECDTTSNRCAAGCLTADFCLATQSWDACTDVSCDSDGSCVGTPQCGDGQACVNGACVASCAGSDQSCDSYSAGEVPVCEDQFPDWLCSTRSAGLTSCWSADDCPAGHFVCTGYGVCRESCSTPGDYRCCGVGAHQYCLSDGYWSFDCWRHDRSTGDEFLDCTAVADECEPDCGQGCAGDPDGCGRACPDPCAESETCSAGVCSSCSPVCGGLCSGAPDSCGGTCSGDCTEDQGCDDEQHCCGRMDAYCGYGLAPCCGNEGLTCDSDTGLCG